MKFTEDFIERVRDANNLVDLISQHTQLRPAAGGFMGRCPFPDHAEKTPSFSVSESKQVYNCFGCHKKGNIYTFVQNFMGLSFPEAVEFLANRAHISLPEDNQVDSAQQDALARKKKDILKLNKIALQYFSECYRALGKDHPVRLYAEQKRGLKPTTISEFQIGYAPKEWDGLSKFIQSKGGNLSLADEARLIKRRQPGDSYGDGYIDIFRDRLMFPIFNQLGEPVAFGGRIVGQGEPKYLNSGETLVFNKGKILYGLSQTAKFIRSDDQVLVVEGYMDLVSLYQEGIRNAVAPMGTALTSDQCRLLARMTKNVVVLFDGDEAGQRAAERSLTILLGSEVHPKGLILPSEMDPDDFVKSQGADSLTNLISTSPDLFSMVLGIWLRGYRGEASEKVKLSDLLQPVFAAIQDLRLKKLYLKESAEKLKVDENWLRDALRGPSNKTPNRSVNVVESRPLQNQSQNQTPITENSVERVSLKGATKVESTMLALSLKSVNNFKMIQEYGAFDFVLHPGIRSLLEKAAVTYRQGPEKFDKLAGLLTSFVDQPELLFADFSERLVSNEVKSEANKESSEIYNVVKGLDDQLHVDIEKEKQEEVERKILKDCLHRLKDQFLKNKADKLAVELKGQVNGQMTTEQRQEKLEELMRIQRDRLAINKEA